MRPKLFADVLNGSPTPAGANGIGVTGRVHCALDAACGDDPAVELELRSEPECLLTDGCDALAVLGVDKRQQLFAGRRSERRAAAEDLVHLPRPSRFVVARIP